MIAVRAGVLLPVDGLVVLAECISRASLAFEITDYRSTIFSRCTEAELQARMADSEFWDFVLNGVHPGDDPEVPFEDLDEPDVLELHNLAPCDVCGERGACGYDMDGRPLIHTIPSEED